MSQITAAYVAHPPLAKVLDRLLRVLSYLCIVATAPFGCPHPCGAWPVDLVVFANVGMLTLGAIGCAHAVVRAKPQQEWVLSYLVIGSLSVHLVQHLGSEGPTRYSVVVLAYLLFVGARTNYLANLRMQAHRLKDVIA